MVTIEAVEKRLSQLREGREQMVRNVHAADGAIADCEYWLALLREGADDDKSGHENAHSG